MDMVTDLQVNPWIYLPFNILENDNVQKFIGDATIRKVIVVPGKLVNIVAN